MERIQARIPRKNLTLHIRQLMKLIPTKNIMAEATEITARILAILIPANNGYIR